MKLRGYKPAKREEQENVVRFVARLPQKKKRVYVLCLLALKVVGVLYVRKMTKAMEEAEVDKGIMIASCRYTHAAKREAKKHNIELIPRNFPAFNIFKHNLVPIHEVVSPEKAEELLRKYRIKAHQLPRIKATDVPIIAIGAKLGDIVKITRDSPTAGKHVTYRVVIFG